MAGVAGPSGKGWGKTTLRSMLANEIYTGTLVWGRNSKRGLPPIRVENACPAIVTREEFDRAQVLLAERSFESAHPRRTSSPNLEWWIRNQGSRSLGEEVEEGLAGDLRVLSCEYVTGACNDLDPHVWCYGAYV